MESQFRSIIRQKIVDAQEAPLPVLTRRDVWLPAVKGKATAVIGMRRAGKTSLLWQILADRHAAGMGRDGLLYFSFEDERLAGMQVQDLDLLVEAFYRLNPAWRDARRAGFFLDEIQLVPGWELFARRLLDSENIELFLSGSSARLLSREVASSMRGRAMEAVVSPFSFRERLRHAGREPDRPADRLIKAEQSRLDRDLHDYLTQGGFPEAQGLDSRTRLELLRSYVDVVLLRDIVERHNLSQPQVLRWMVQQLLGNAAGAFSINKFHADLKSRAVAVSKETLHSLLAHLEDAFLLCSIGIATDSERRRQVNPRKVYPVDTGLIPLFDRSGKPNIGHALETLVLHELHRRGAEVAYVKTPDGFEVDFHARTFVGDEMLIQVCATLDDPATLAREVRALEDASLAYPNATLHLIALDFPAHIQVPPAVQLYRASHWLLDIPGNSGS
ncbi:MAG: ATP-binding protein [Gammaproteobacteria bacterium]|nr:ATP-binding protein [Gammaproteobacteria bacterium]MBU1654761.1 ATP-binding protein [Gammaproteobacteria bacterium]MBU1959658.1 ATP-binding protein [Gammaproteobacteria bacterium]